MEEKLYWGLGPSLGPVADVCSELGILDCIYFCCITVASIRK